MGNFSKIIEPFEKHYLEYDAWFDAYPAVFQSEVEALREMLPVGESHGIEVGLGSGRFSVALGIKEGIEPSFELRNMAYKRGIEVMDAVAEKLPFRDLHFDFVLMPGSISYFYALPNAFEEANRVLKIGGSIIIGFIEKESPIGKFYSAKKDKSTFYKNANLYSMEHVVKELKKAGFHDFEFKQTLFKELDEITEFEASKPGYGEGSFSIIKALKK
jgi:ubiquinone/menaquinone biosynthesis C-methylase UbiE